MPVSPYTQERLDEAARSSRTLSEALTKLGVDPKSSTRRYLNERMKKLDVDISHFEHEGVRWTKDLRRALRETGVPEHCAKCGTAPEWNGKPMTLEIDHINGDWSDDRRENLRLLCPNCHAITSTWCRGGKQRRT
ncbi:HNH endonuclease signature motif containing protein [Streptomyces sp. RLB1-33]|nr:HNH endonuclease signature motif containing protein [Streptomyces sp. RLB1-33]QIY71318.1 HNH endonuclease [Streptomyces sp. RLB1-33]